MNKDGQEFAYLAQKFPCLSEPKVKEGIFVGPHVKELSQDPDFKNKLNAAERRAWDVFKLFKKDKI